MMVYTQQVLRQSFGSNLSRQITRFGLFPVLSRASTAQVFSTARTIQEEGRPSAKWRAMSQENKPPKHQMAYFKELVTSERSFGVFRKVMHTGLYSQLVAMEVPVNGEIGDEVHTVDQILIFTSGHGLATVAGKDQPVGPGDLVIVPAGTQHQFVTKGDKPLELLTVYAPAEHWVSTVHKDKAQGDKEEDDGIDEAPEWSQQSKKENEAAGLVKTDGGPYEGE